ncbi:uncharacterized protein EV422DRAFT_527272 [Fimicolochytrium jonesii]|uniref:uncharacterized protein n=1 Tax=Fimicolochytrium jonesii TaxID=1396493 RepID=UPI0022FF1DC6|nr:uncharacterized protein EV422DRAFT_527272 [Fimicolochytrium jonesii]KAI8821846.1 hypothetical protein EV422DRAFT_527272 [Fimicolochytrium jonesii]
MGKIRRQTRGYSTVNAVTTSSTEADYAESPEALQVTEYLTSVESCEDAPHRIAAVEDLCELLRQPTPDPDVVYAILQKATSHTERRVYLPRTVWSAAIEAIARSTPPEVARKRLSAALRSKARYGSHVTDDDVLMLSAASAHRLSTAEDVENFLIDVGRSFDKQLNVALIVQLMWGLLRQGKAEEAGRFIGAHVDRKRRFVWKPTFFREVVNQLMALCKTQQAILLEKKMRRELAILETNMESVLRELILSYRESAGHGAVTTEDYNILAVLKRHSITGFEEAAMYLRHMGADNFVPDARTFGHLIDPLILLDKPSDVAKLLGLAKRRGFEDDIALEGHVLWLFVRQSEGHELADWYQGRFAGARQELIRKHFRTMELLLNRLLHHGYPEMAATVATDIHQAAKYPSKYTSERIVEDLLVVGHFERAYEYFRVLTGSVSEDLKDAESLPITERFFSVLIREATKRRATNEAIAVYDKMRELGLRPSCMTLTPLVAYCSNTRDDVTLGRVFHNMEADGVIPDEVICAVMMQRYMREGAYKAAAGLLGFMQRSGVAVTPQIYSTYMGGLIKAGRVDAVAGVLRSSDPKHGYSSLLANNALLRSHIDAGHDDTAWALWTNMRENRDFNHVTFSIMWPLMFKRGLEDDIQLVFRELMARVIGSDGAVADARNLSKPKQPNPSPHKLYTLYDIMLDRYLQHDALPSALAVFSEMKEKHRDLVTVKDYLALIGAAAASDANGGGVTTALQLFTEAQDVLPRVAEANRLPNHLAKRSVVLAPLFDGAITRLLKYGHRDEAMLLFHRAKGRKLFDGRVNGVVISHTTYAAVVAAYCAAPPYTERNDLGMAVKYHADAVRYFPSTLDADANAPLIIPLVKDLLAATTDAGEIPGNSKFARRRLQAVVTTHLKHFQNLRWDAAVACLSACNRSKMWEFGGWIIERVRDGGVDLGGERTRQPAIPFIAGTSPSDNTETQPDPFQTSALTKLGNTVLEFYAKQGLAKQMEYAFVEMRQGVWFADTFTRTPAGGDAYSPSPPRPNDTNILAFQPDTATYTILLDGYGRAREPRNAWELFKEVLLVPGVGPYPGGKTATQRLESNAKTSSALATHSQVLPLPTPTTTPLDARIWGIGHATVSVMLDVLAFAREDTAVQTLWGVITGYIPVKQKKREGDPNGVEREKQHSMPIPVDVNCITSYLEACVRCGRIEGVIEVLDRGTEEGRVASHNEGSSSPSTNDASDNTVDDTKVAAPPNTAYPWMDAKTLTNVVLLVRAAELNSNKVEVYENRLWDVYRRRYPHLWEAVWQRVGVSSRGGRHIGIGVGVGDVDSRGKERESILRKEGAWILR